MLGVGVLVAASTVVAQTPRELGTFNAWTAFSDGAGADRYCYMVATPESAALADRRGDIYVLVYHRPEGEEFNVVQVDIGYTFQDGAEAEITIKDETWKLFTREGTAWAYSAEDDKAIVAAMRKGLTMNVKGTSSRGNPTTDEYSLRGVSAAHGAISRACTAG